MPKPLDALDYLSHPKKHPALPVCVLFGDEAYLKRQALLALREEVLGEAGEFSLARFDGDEAEWREVSDELSTVALFGGGKRLVAVEDGDDFVSRNRSLLEDYAARPKSTAVLVLEVKSWPSNTRLFKALAESGLQIECKFPAPARLLKWLASQAQTHDARLEPAAAETLVDVVEPDLGLFDQELTKLAALAGSGGTITAARVHEAVGGWRTRTTWEMLDAALAGNTAEALVQLDRLLAAGEVPIALLGQIASTLRRFAAATRLVEQAERAGRRVSLREALEEAGFKPFVLSRAEPQLRQLGRVRGSKLYRWLLEADLALKGGSSAPGRARLVLEELLVRLSARSPSLAGGPAR
jgi:DNA polymerase-3 subunit delta